VSRGGNDEQSVFERVRHLSNTLPGLTSLTAILFSDGGFMCGPHLKETYSQATFNKLQVDMSAEQKANKVMTSRWMSIGFGRNHDANLMNKIG